MARKWLLPPRGLGMPRRSRVLKEDTDKKHFVGSGVVKQDQAAAAPAAGNRFKMMI